MKKVQKKKKKEKKFFTGCFPFGFPISGEKKVEKSKCFFIVP